jgi:hypothetical protein
VLECKDYGVRDVMVLESNVIKAKSDSIYMAEMVNSNV